MTLLVDCIFQQIKNKYVKLKYNVWRLAVIAYSGSTLEHEAVRNIRTSDTGTNTRIQKSILCNVKRHKLNYNHQMKEDETVWVYRTH
jgi:hypothetical protein